MKILLKSGVYESLPKNSRVKFWEESKGTPFQTQTTLLTDLKYKLTPYYSKYRHLYDLLKSHASDIPLRPIVCSICTPCYVLAGFLHKILSHLAGKLEPFIKNSGQFL
jgi:hypothetical protein